MTSIAHDVAPCFNTVDASYLGYRKYLVSSLRSAVNSCLAVIGGRGCQASPVRVAIGSDEVFCRSVEAQPGRGHTSHRQRRRPSSLHSSPALPVHGALPSHQSGVLLSLAPPSAPPPPLLPADLFDGSPGWQEEACRRAVSYHLSIYFFIYFYFSFRPECLKLPSRPERSAEPIFRFVHQKRYAGLLLRAISSQVLHQDRDRNSRRVGNEESG